MALAQNKFLIVTVSPDGNRQLVTTSALGEAEIAALDEWEISGGKLQPKAGVAPNGVSVNTAPTNFAKLFADFTNAGANLVVNSGTYQNNTFSQDHAAVTPGVTSGTDAPGGSFNVWNLGLASVAGCTNTVVTNFINTANSTAYSANDLGFAWDVCVVDFGSSKNITEIHSIQADQNRHLTISGCNDWNGTTGTWADIYTRAQFQTDGDANATVNVNVNYRYVKYRVDSTTRAYLNRAELNGDAYYDSTNTTETNLHTGSSVNFAPASLEITDENDTNITGSGKVNVDYKLNNGSYTGSLIDIETFRALSASTFASLTQLDIKFQPVGAQRIKDPNIDSESSESLLLADGSLQALINAAVVGKMSADGYTFPDGTTQPTAVIKVDAPASASATGTTGQIAWDTGFIYICTATDTWKRIAVATW